MGAASRTATSPTRRRSRRCRSRDPTPRRAPAAGGPARGPQLDAGRLAEVERQVRGGLAEDGADHQAMPPRIARKKAAAPSAPPRPIQIRAATSATGRRGRAAAARTRGGTAGRRSRTRPGRSTGRSEAAHQADAAQADDPGGLGGRGLAGGRRAARARIPSTSSTAWPTSDMPAPPISIRCVGPQSVTSWPKSRCQTSSSGKPIRANAPQAAIRRPPTGAYQSRAMRTAAGPGRPFGSRSRGSPR